MMVDQTGIVPVDDIRADDDKKLTTTDKRTHQVGSMDDQFSLERSLAYQANEPLSKDGCDKTFFV